MNKLNITAMQNKESKVIENSGMVTFQRAAEIASKFDVPSKKTVHMSKEFEDAAKRLETARDSVVAHMNELHEAVVSSQERTTKIVSKSKDLSNQLMDQLIRVNKILGNDYEQKLCQLERLTDCLCKLQELKSNNQLSNLLDIICKK